MSQENVELGLRWCAAMGEGAEATHAAVAELADANVDFYPVGKFPDAEPCHGQEEFSSFLDRFLDSYSRAEWTVRHATSVGDDRVLVWANLQTEGRGSGMALEGDVYICFWFRHGRFFRIENHVTPGGAIHALGLEGDALEAVGLSE